MAASNASNTIQHLESIGKKLARFALEDPNVVGELNALVESVLPGPFILARPIVDLVLRDLEGVLDKKLSA